MSNDQKKSLDEQLLAIAKEKYEKENDETKEKLKEKGITIEKALELYPLPQFLDFYYIANNYEEEEKLDDSKEYEESLSDASKDNYRYLKEALEELTTEEKILFYKYYTLSYLADIYVEIENYEDALEVICINIEDKLESLRPVYDYSEEQIKEYFVREGFNPRKSEMLNEDNIYLEKVTKEINNEVIDHSKPYSFEDINNNTKENEGLEFKYLLFCEEYLKRGKLTDTCKYLGIGRATAYRWLELDEVKEYLKKRREELGTEAKQRYNDLYYKCFNELENTIEKGYTQEKLKAVDIFLKHYDNVKRLEAPTISED